MDRLFAPRLWLALAAALGFMGVAFTTHAYGPGSTRDMVTGGVLGLMAVGALFGAAYLHVHRDRAP